MIGPEEALRRVLDAVRPLPAAEVPLAEAAGRALAADLAAREDLPAFDNSAMDGYAVRAADCAGAARNAPVALALGPGSRAGAEADFAVEAGRAARILTGAPVPRGADAVVMQELTRLSGDGRVEILGRPEPGLHIREKGEDLRRGESLLSAGKVLRTYEIALLAAQGFETVPAARAPRVVVLATGDELLGGGRAGLRDANGPGLAAAVARWGGVPSRLPPVGDDLAAVAAALDASVETCDLVLVTGGVSVGDRDFTREALESVGGKVVFAGVSIKPGKPLLFGLLRGRPVFGLPGNPVAALVCAEEFVRPALERLRGRPGAGPGFHIDGVAEGEYPLHGDRVHYLFCVAREEGGRWLLDILRPQGSHRLATACRANALAVASGGPRRIGRGELLRFRWLK